MRDREREIDRDRDRDRQTERERQTERQRETERDRERNPPPPFKIFKDVFEIQIRNYALLS